MRFRVPQFIDVKDKIFGPLTFKQFLYLTGGAGVIAIIYYFVRSFFFTILLGLPVVVLSLALAFYQVNQKPFIYIVEAFFKYLSNARFYIWKRRRKKVKGGTAAASGGSTLSTPQIGGSKLRELTWNLDVADAANPVKKKQSQSDEAAERGQSTQVNEMRDRGS